MSMESDRTSGANMVVRPSASIPVFAKPAAPQPCPCGLPLRGESARKPVDALYVKFMAAARSEFDGDAWRISGNQERGAPAPAPLGIGRARGGRCRGRLDDAGLEPA
mmetsp:Transcript_15917/g.45340  ORF Transcript_15917/g.45340 Transcript_15917/m.45340 type:complete len:107 (-) Transcript_15917:3-323(-)